jgi:heme exporter protein A
MTGTEVLRSSRPGEGEPSAVPAAAAPAVALDGIARRYIGRWALRGVSLHVEPGEILALMGRNGSGKTTLLRIVATLLRPTRGSGRVFGHDLVREADAVRSLIGMLAHNTGLYDDLTAEENLRFAARMLGVPADEALLRSHLDDVGLGHVVRERVRGFSAGMQRRLALARLRLQRPQLLLLDEPYNTVDEDGVALVNRLLEDTRARGGAAIVVTHDLGRGKGVLDRVVRLVDGKAQ